jgi:hypothetical protein
MRRDGARISMSSSCVPPLMNLVTIHRFCCRRCNIERLPSLITSEENVEGGETNAPEMYLLLCVGSWSNLDLLTGNGARVGGGLLHQRFTAMILGCWWQLMSKR